MLYQNKENTILKDHQIFGIYFPTTYLDLNRHFINNYIFIISKNKEEKYFYSYYTGGKFQSELNEMHYNQTNFISEYGLLGIKNKYTFEIKANGDLAMKNNKYNKSGINNYHNYYLKFH